MRAISRANSLTSRCRAQLSAAAVWLRSVDSVEYCQVTPEEGLAGGVKEAGKASLRSVISQMITSVSESIMCSSHSATALCLWRVLEQFIRPTVKKENRTPSHAGLFGSINLASPDNRDGKDSGE